MSVEAELFPGVVVSELPEVLESEELDGVAGVMAGTPSTEVPALETGDENLFVLDAVVVDDPLFRAPLRVVVFLRVVPRSE